MRATTTSTHVRSPIGEGFSKRLTGKPTAFRPPGYPYLLGGAYRVFGVERGGRMPTAIRVARTLGAVLGALGVALIGMLGVQLLGRTAGLVAMGLAAVYVPAILVSEAIMSEQLFVVLMLGSARDRDPSAPLGPSATRSRSWPACSPGSRC